MNQTWNVADQSLFKDFQITLIQQQDTNVEEWTMNHVKYK